MQRTGRLKLVTKGVTVVGAVLIMTRASAEFPDKVCDLVFRSGLLTRLIWPWAGKQVKVHGIVRPGRYVNFIEVFAIGLVKGKTMQIRPGCVITQLAPLHKPQQKSIGQYDSDRANTDGDRNRELYASVPSIGF